MLFLCGHNRVLILHKFSNYLSYNLLELIGLAVINKLFIYIVNE